MTASRVVPIPTFSDRTITGPAAPAFYALVLSYPTDSELKQAAAERAEGTSIPAGAIRLLDEPTLSWVPLSGPAQQLAARGEMAESLRVLDKITLAHVGILNGKIHSLRREVRAMARPLQLPVITAGRAPIRHAGFEPVRALFGQALYTASVLVSTTHAGFGSEPRYMARIEEKSETEPKSSDRLVESELAGIAVQRWVEVAAPSRHEFRVNIYVPGPPVMHGVRDADVPAEVGTFARELDHIAETRWSIVWIGVEGSA